MTDKKKDIVFGIKSRSSGLGGWLSEKNLRPLIKFIKTKSGKKFVFISALIFSLLIDGVIPTLNFIFQIF